MTRTALSFCETFIPRTPAVARPIDRTLPSSKREAWPERDTMMIVSPSLIVWSLETRSSSRPPPDPWRTMPTALVCRSTAATALDASVNSVTREALRVTRVTLPTRPSAVTTGACSLTPSAEPAEITICWSNSPGGRARTRALIAEKSAGKRGPST